MKELIYLQTGELRSTASFIGRVHNLIQVPVNHKTTVAVVHELLGKEFDANDEGWDAFTDYVEHTPPSILKKKWYELLDIIPNDEGTQFYAIFDLKTIKT